MYDRLKQAVNSISRITDNDWLLLEPYLKTRDFRKNEFYLKAGETERQIGFICSGSFRWYYMNQKGEEVNYHFFLDNNFVVDYLSFITQAPTQMFIQAMEDTSIIMLPNRAIILESYAQSHNWERFGRLISEGVYTDTVNRVHDFLFRSAEERYINLMKQHPDIFQRVSLSHISSYLGIQGPSLSRIRKRISRQ